MNQTGGILDVSGETLPLYRNISLCESPASGQNCSITPSRTLKKLSGDSVASYVSVRLYATHV